MAIQPERQTALEYANAFAGAPEETVARAEAYLAFLTGGSASTSRKASTKPAPTEPSAGTPLTPEERAANGLDEVNPTAGPEVTGTPEPDPTPSSAANAGSGSETEQPTEVAQAAATSQSAPDLTKVQAAVLAVNKAIGREGTVAILTAHGGARVPEIPVENHRALFEALNAKLPADQQIVE